jgi:hypothetical protein
VFGFVSKWERMGGAEPCEPRPGCTRRSPHVLHVSGKTTHVKGLYQIRAHGLLDAQRHRAHAEPRRREVIPLLKRKKAAADPRKRPVGYTNEDVVLGCHT